MIKAVIFDWAGVIGADGYWIWIKENAEDITAVKDKLHSISEVADKGEITLEEFIRHIAKHTGRSVDEVWPGIKEKIVVNHELIAFIKRLRNHYKTALLSNFRFELLDEIMTEQNLYGLFDEVIISSKHKLLKPEPAIFEKMLSLLQLNKDEVVFIDDREIHVAGAEAFGIKAFLYTSNEQLVKDLKSCGVHV